MHISPGEIIRVQTPKGATTPEDAVSVAEYEPSSQQPSTQPVTIAERVKQLINRPTPQKTPTVITLQVPTNETQKWHQARSADWLKQIKWVEETPGTEYSRKTPSGPTNRWAVQQGGTAAPASTSRASTKRGSSALSLMRMYMCSLPYLSRLRPEAVDAMANDAQASPFPRRLREMSAPDNTAASNTTALIKIDSWAPAELIANQSEDDIFHFSTAAGTSPQKLKRARTSAMSDAKPEASEPMTYGDAIVFCLHFASFFLFLSLPPRSKAANNYLMAGTNV